MNHVIVTDATTTQTVDNASRHASGQTAVTQPIVKGEYKTIISREESWGETPHKSGSNENKKEGNDLDISFF